jgi:uncharacterized repeat protein (TIGR03803 family)
MKTTRQTTRHIEAGISRRTWPWLLTATVALGLMATPLRAQVPEIIFYTTNQTAPTTFTASLAVFTSNGLGTNVESFAWYFNTHLIPGATNYLLNIFDAQATNAGSYEVVVSDTHGAVTSSPPMTLTVANISYRVPSLQFSTLASFNEYVDGAFPQAGLIQGRDGYLYGTTLGGGTNASGTNGTVFKMSTNGNFAWSVAFNNADGQAPAAGLVQASDGNLYGTTGYGGTKGFGTVFRITTNGALTSLYSFDPGQLDGGGSPQAPLCIGLDGYLYGTTTTNGSGSFGGTLFKMSTNGGPLVWSYPLANSNGTVPVAGLVQGLDGSLYGTASDQGANGAGSVFRISTNEVFTNLYSFTGLADGGYPYGGLVQGPDSQLYGTTSWGGDTNLNYGTLFKITTNGAFTVLLAFEGTNGGAPDASLMVAGDGNLYGTAKLGGIGYEFSLNNPYPPAYGTIFQLTTNGTLTTLLSLDGNYDGAAPHSSLWQGLDGGLYGTTSEGGTNDLALSLPSLGDGTVFRLGVVRPTILSAYVKDNTFFFTWSALAGVPYQTQYTENLGQPQWIDFGGTVVGTNGIGSQSDPIGTNKARFYRVSLFF